MIEKRKGGREETKKLPQITQQQQQLSFINLHHLGLDVYQVKLIKVIKSILTVDSMNIDVKKNYMFELHKINSTRDSNPESFLGSRVFNRRGTLYL